MVPKYKVFTGKAFWLDGEPMSADQKGEFLRQVIRVRDSPSEDLIHKNQADLKVMTQGLTIRPGNAVNLKLFSEYYEQNWESCSFRWVKAFRKNLPLKGANDTQAIESTFSAIKRYLKVEFRSRTPTMEEVISILPKILDERSYERDVY